jgi:hypothetical protein
MKVKLYRYEILFTQRMVDPFLCEPVYYNMELERMHLLKKLKIATLGEKTDIQAVFLSIRFGEDFMIWPFAGVFLPSFNRVIC